VLTTRFFAAENFREIVQQAKDHESETAESRSRNNAPFSLTCDGIRTHSDLDIYEFSSRLVCPLHMSPALKSASSDELFSVSIFLRLVSIVLLCSALVCEAAESPAGRWEGSIQIPGSEFPLIVDLERVAGKAWAGSIIIPGLGVKGAPLTELSVGDSGISFTIKAALASERTGQAKFRGRVTSAGQLTGDFLQAGNTAPFVLQKIGPPQVELPRKSTANSQELEGEWKGDYEMDGYPRHVTLTLANHKPGGASAQLVIAGKKSNNAAVELVTEERGFLTIKSSEFGITYEGRFRKEAGEINGTFTIGPFELPLVLRRLPGNAR
jgi:hypothetical protein